MYQFMQSLSTVYSVMKIESVARLAAPLGFSSQSVQMFIVASDLSIKINQKASTITFVSSSECLYKFAHNLQAALAHLPSSDESKLSAISLYLEQGSAQKEEYLARKQAHLLEKMSDQPTKVDKVDNSITKKSKSEIEEEKKIAGLLAIQKAEAEKLSIRILGDLKAQGMKANTDLSVLSVPELKLYQDKQEVLIKENRAQKLKTVSKRNDYFVRACRVEEIKKLAEFNEQQVEASLKAFELKKIENEVKLVSDYERALEINKRCARMV